MPFQAKRALHYVDLISEIARDVGGWGSGQPLRNPRFGPVPECGGKLRVRPVTVKTFLSLLGHHASPQAEDPAAPRNSPAWGG